MALSAEKHPRAELVSSYPGFSCGLQHPTSCQHSYPLNKECRSDGEFLQAVRVSDSKNQIHPHLCLQFMLLALQRAQGQRPVTAGSVPRARATASPGWHCSAHCSLLLSPFKAT